MEARRAEQLSAGPPALLALLDSAEAGCRQGGTTQLPLRETPPGAQFWVNITQLCASGFLVLIISGMFNFNRSFAIIKLMVKLPFSGGNKGHTSKASSAIVVGDDMSKKIFNPDLGMKNSYKLVAVIVLVISALVMVGVHRHTNSKFPAGAKQIPMGRQYIQNQIADLKKREPAQSAPLASKLAYYDELMTTESSSGDYKAAVETYETRVRLSDNGLSALQLFRVAQWYQQLGEKPAALSALARAQAVLSAGNNGDLPVGQFQASIDQLKQELSK